MARFRFDLIFNNELGERHTPGNRVVACCCKNWRDVRRMLNYYGRENVTVFKVRWQPNRDWKHDKRKPTPKEVAAYLKRYEPAV